jgi:hypothetical protein
MATKKTTATAPKFNGPPGGWGSGGLANPNKVVVVTAVPRVSGGYGYTPTTTVAPPSSYTGGRNPTKPAVATPTNVPPVSGAFSSGVGGYGLAPAPAVTVTPASMSPANRAELAGLPGGSPSGGGPPTAYSSAQWEGVNPFSEEGRAGEMFNAGLGTGKTYAAQSTNIPVNTAPTPVITNGAVDYNNMVSTKSSNTDVVRALNNTGYTGQIIGFRPDGTPIYDVTQGGSGAQGTTGVLPPRSYATPPGSTVPPWEFQYPRGPGGDLEIPTPPNTGGGGGGGGYLYYGGGGGGGGDYGNYATSMGLFNWRIGL